MPARTNIVYFTQSAAKTDTVYKTQKIDTQTKEKKTPMKT